MLPNTCSLILPRTVLNDVILQAVLIFQIFRLFVGYKQLLLPSSPTLGSRSTRSSLPACVGVICLPKTPGTECAGLKAAEWKEHPNMFRKTDTVTTTRTHTKAADSCNLDKGNNSVDAVSNKATIMHLLSHSLIGDDNSCLLLVALVPCVSECRMGRPLLFAVTR